MNSNYLFFIASALILSSSLSAQVQDHKDSSKTLKPVVITGRKPLIEQKIDRIIVNVDAMITAAGNNVLDVLAKSPGVRVDNNGDISLNGTGGVTILIDDKPTYLSSADLAAYLRGLPGALLDKIELMTNPPARYDAAGTAVINLILKKNKQAGFNGSGSLGYNQGMYANTNDALIVNYREGRVNWFGNLSYGRDASEDRSTNDRYYFQPDGTPTATIMAGTISISKGTSFNGKIGMDYQLAPHTTAGILVTGVDRHRADTRDFTDRSYGPGMQPDSVTASNTTGDYRRRSIGINLNGQHSFRTGNRQLTADLDLVHNQINGSQDLPSRVYAADGAFIDFTERMIRSPSDIHIYSAKTDYSGEMAGKIKLEAGAKTSYVVNDFLSQWYDRSGDQFLLNGSRSNHFFYNENINAAYIGASRDWRRWTVKAGLRLENTNGNGRLAGTDGQSDSVHSSSYTRAFPTVYLQYKLDSSGAHSITLSYSERIRRPNYGQLNPFLSYVDSYNYSSGNPNLNPQYSHFAELKYAYKQYIGFSVADGYNTGLIQSLIQTNGTIFITRPQNFGITNSVNFNLYSSLSPVKWWDLNGSFTLYHLLNKGTAYGQSINEQMTGSESRFNNQLHFGKGWNAELSGIYIGRHDHAQFSQDPFLMLNAGLQKSVLKDNGTLTLTLNDLLHKVEPGGHSYGLIGVATVLKHETDSRRVGVAFNYRFGKAANARKSKHNNGGAGEEQGRAN